jgi:hypothetical protein
MTTGERQDFPVFAGVCRPCAHAGAQDKAPQIGFAAQNPEIFSPISA